MSEFDNEYTSGSSERNESVEAFDDFEMSAEEMADAEDTAEVFDTVEVTDDMESVQAAVEAVEQVEAAAEDAAEDTADPEEEPEAAEDIAESDDEEPEAAEDITESDGEEPEAAEDITESDGEEPEAAENIAESGDEEPDTAEDIAESDDEEPDTAEDIAESGDEEPEAAEDITESGDEEPDTAEDITESDDEEPDTAEDITESGDEEPDTAEDITESDDEEPEAAEDIAESDGEESEAAEDITESDGEELDQSDKDEVEIDIMSTILALENAATDSDESNEAADTEESFAEVHTEQDAESENQEADEADETVSDDDYLDYDDTPRPKKLISGRAAAVTMIVTGVVTIALIVGAVWMGITLKRDIGVTVASYSDRFNACKTQEFKLGSLIGVELISMSDETCILSQNDMNDLKAGKTVTKFNNLLNIKADTRLGRIVSMDITYDQALNQQKNPSVTCMVLLGNALSGLFENVDTSDKAFMTAYTALVEKCYPAPAKGSDVYVYNADNGISVYADYSKMSKSGAYSDVMIHIENNQPNYIDAQKLDFSWLPFGSSSKGDQSANGTTSPSDK